jgi:hypothetical protein
MKSRTISVDAITRQRAADLGPSLSSVVRRALAEVESRGPRSVTGVWLDDAAGERLGELCQADRRHASEVVAWAVDELWRRQRAAKTSGGSDHE